MKSRYIEYLDPNFTGIMHFPLRLFGIHDDIHGENGICHWGKNRFRFSRLKSHVSATLFIPVYHLLQYFLASPVQQQDHKLSLRDTGKRCKMLRSYRRELDYGKNISHRRI